jgi:hypothetical protein
MRVYDPKTLKPLDLNDHYQELEEVFQKVFPSIKILPFPEQGMLLAKTPRECLCIEGRFVTALGRSDFRISVKLLGNLDSYDLSWDDFDAEEMLLFKSWLGDIKLQLHLVIEDLQTVLA